MRIHVCVGERKEKGKEWQEGEGRVGGQGSIGSRVLHLCTEGYSLPHLVLLFSRTRARPVRVNTHTHTQRERARTYLQVVVPAGGVGRI